MVAQSMNVYQWLKVPREVHQENWLKKQLRLLPEKWAARVERRYWHLDKKHGRELEANIYVREIVEPLSIDIDISASDSQIQDLAKYNARHIENGLLNCAVMGQAKFIDLMQGMCLRYGVAYPFAHELESITARLICSAWWLRNLRSSFARAREKACIDAGLVHKKANLYCSDDTLEARRAQIKRNQELLEGVEIENESGERLTLAQAAAAGMANTHNRVNELITRTKGFQELADKYSHQCLFVTVTAPSRFHAVKANGQPNPKYNKATPRDTQQYLTKQWTRCRALLAWHGVKFYGLRVVEPHHDATPHWHLALWVKDEKSLHKLRSAFKTYFLRGEECDYLERGAVLNRLKFKRCDSRGAVGYMLKYIIKNMRGHGIDGEADDESDNKSIYSESSAERVEAWASTWRIRQFQQIGGHSVSVWRELRRVEKVELAKTIDGLQEGALFSFVDTYIYKAWQSVQKHENHNANFAEFIEAMGGLDVKPKESFLQLANNCALEYGRYGRDYVYKKWGVIERYGSAVLKSKRESWVRV